ncbi:CRAL-TRIO domain-containing protein [Pavlovales sp. CCMP2436]|nr:CRAL-TRIO domain-containing protein [Pavlovales sp. CCMP2436]|mmetsp:Transcript_46876/g.108057  ORF Transcript_46876/g.108057 Transcript_46876/m.108057 type:complete len:370 (+) Transcript_46876:1386-2495(+)
MASGSASAMAHLFKDASSFDDRIHSLADIARMEDALPAATQALRALLEADAEKVDWPQSLLQQSLRVSYLDVERSALILRNLARFRAEQKWALRMDSHSCDTALRTRVHVVLPQPDLQGRAVLVFNAAWLDPNMCPVKEFHKMASYVMEQLTLDPAVQHRGITILLNLQGVDLGMARHFSLADIKRGVGMWKDCFPCKVKRILIVNASSMQQRLLGAALSVVHPRVRARVSVVRDQKTLSDSISIEALPIELGGLLDDLKMWAEWVDAKQKVERPEETPHALFSRAAFGALPPMIPRFSPKITEPKPEAQSKSAPAAIIRMRSRSLQPVPSAADVGANWFERLVSRCSWKPAAPAHPPPGLRRGRSTSL